MNPPKLVHELAILPNALDPGRLEVDVNLRTQIKELLKDVTLTNSQSNVLVANLCRGDWGDLVASKLAHAVDEEVLEHSDLQALRVLLNKLLDSNRIVSVPPTRKTAPVSEQDWLHEACECKQLDWIASAGPTLLPNDSCQAAVVHLCDLRDTPSWLQKTTSLRLPRDVPGYRLVLGPLLRHASKLKIVDPYLRPDGQNGEKFKVVILAARLMGKPGSKCVIELHTSHQDTLHPDAYLDKWEEDICALKRDCDIRHVFRVCLWSHGRDLFHDRYVLTNHWGVKLGKSLESKTSTTQTETWDLITEQARQDQWKDYEVLPGGHVSDSAPFNLRARPRAV